MGKFSLNLTKEYLIEEYVNKQRSLQDIALEVGCCRQNVYKKICFYEIPMRNKSSARTLALRLGKLKKYYYDPNFFTTWSREMAWVLGVIFTDGNVHKSNEKYSVGRLQISQKEPELLKKVLKCMSCDAVIRKYQNGVSKEKEYYLHVFNIGGDKLWNELINLGVTPNKSLNMQFPEMPRDYIRHFIRGCWDGDGSVYIQSQQSQIRASYVCGSLPFISRVRQELINYGILCSPLYTSIRSKNPIYSFHVRIKSLKMLFHYFYWGVSSSQYLARKYHLLKLTTIPKFYTHRHVIQSGCYKNAPNS